MWLDLKREHSDIGPLDPWTHGFLVRCVNPSDTAAGQSIFKLSGHGCR